jgi:energy-coupling factor transporter ATP-binding protein EcfA2
MWANFGCNQGYDEKTDALICSDTLQGDRNMARKKREKQKKELSARQKRRMRIGQVIAIAFAILIVLSFILTTVAPQGAVGF